MHKLIRDLLDLTRLESGQRNRQLGPVDLRAVAQAAAETMRAEADARGIALRIHADGAAQMTADAGEIEMLLNNLVSNAVKYNRDGGSVDVTLAQHDGQVVITVADTGIGMTPEEIGRIFGEFVRIRNERTSQILGSGLGLSIVDKLVRLYGGEVKIESKPDVGTTFRVTLGA